MVDAPTTSPSSADPQHRSNSRRARDHHIPARTLFAQITSTLFAQQQTPHTRNPSHTRSSNLIYTRSQPRIQDSPPRSRWSHTAACLLPPPPRNTRSNSLAPSRNSLKLRHTRHRPIILLHLLLRRLTEGGAQWLSTLAYMRDSGDSAGNSQSSRSSGARTLLPPRARL